MPVQGLSCKSFAAPSRFGAAKRANQATSRQNSEEQGRHISNAGFPRFCLLGTRAREKETFRAQASRDRPPTAHRRIVPVSFSPASQPARLVFPSGHSSHAPSTQNTKHESQPFLILFPSSAVPCHSQASLMRCLPNEKEKSHRHVLTSLLSRLEIQRVVRASLTLPHLFSPASLLCWESCEG